MRVVCVESGGSSAYTTFVSGALDDDARINRVVANIPRHGLIVVKPNWVQQSHEYDPEIWEPVITHPDLLLTILECLAERVAEDDSARWTAYLRRVFKTVRVATANGLQHWPRSIPDQLELPTCMRGVGPKGGGHVDGDQTRRSTGYVKVNPAEDSLFYGHSGEGRYYAQTTILRRSTAITI